MCLYSKNEVSRFLNLPKKNFNCICKNISKTRNICERLKYLFFNHSNDKIILDYDINNKTSLFLKKFNLSIHNNEKRIFKKNKKRSPINYQIQELKVQLNNELKRFNSISQPIQPQISCDYALNEICLKHIACHQLWNIFRRSCVVDAQNNCRMTSLAHCWQSYEGISWTGLGNCTCYNKNSDCHWIRLQTNYNKCISEIHNRSMINVIEEKRSFTTMSPKILYTTPVSLNNRNNQHSIEKTVSNNSKHLEANMDQFDYYRNFSNNRQAVSTFTPTKMIFQQPFFNYETYKNQTTDHKILYNNKNYNNRRNLSRIMNVDKNSMYQNVTFSDKPHQLLHVLNSNNSNVYLMNNTTTLKPNKLVPNYLKKISNNSNTLYNKSKDVEIKENITQLSVNRININYQNELRNIRINGEKSIPLQFKNYIYPNVSYNNSEKKILNISTNDNKKNEIHGKIYGTSSYSYLSLTTTSQSILSISRNENIHQINSSLNDRKKLFNMNNNTETKTNNKIYSLSSIKEKKIIKQNYLTKNNEKEEINNTPYYKKISLLSMEEEKKNKNYKSSSNNIDNLEKMNLKEENKLSKKNNQVKTYFNNITTFPNNLPAKLSSCQDAFQLCTQDENCQWLLSSVEMKCKSGNNNNESSCNRQQCAKAIKNFATSRQRGIVEAMMFCQCAPNDSECELLQQLMYPSCLYNLNNSMPNCKDVISNCLKDRSCKHLSKSYFHSCAVSNGSCKPGTYQMNGCRQAVIKLRGSVIDTLCHCEEGDIKCWNHRIELIPLNPCLQKAKDDYAMKGLMPTKPSIIHHDIHMSFKNKDKISNETEKSNLSGTVNLATSTMKNETIIKNKILIDNKNNLNTSYISTKTSNENTGKRMYDNFTLPTGEYHTQEPPSMELGCRMRNFNGDWIEVFKGTIFRQYTDWYGLCSNWCECLGNNTQICKELPCLEDNVCINGNNVMNFGEKLYIKGRGACTCHMGNFICDTPRDFNIDFQPGLYIIAGFSKYELQMFKENVPLEILEKSGLVSDEKMLAKDIASRLQYSLERIMPTGTMCRIIIVEEYLKDEIVILRLQWYGMNIYNKNDTEFGWHVGNLEKVCSPYVKQVARNFLLNMAERYQLVLSSVKQIRVIDLLNELPSVSSGTVMSKNFNVVIFFNFVLISIIVKHIFT
ncbi:GDNF/GAS1 domain-containing protein [Strongyloides ratti]|uniref:GDNF/GAS1 domain-containing protein n=1 Tax=Strongyloides ratti TaxID=34506 RepID=A0A090KTV6_STRRB|nr:GDNF/GAS1 domain-containing protein [Strongyloides ratti]CEF60846.1 GDNF/GAS1 domain-containing protein [Strongyloides ratti]